MGKRLKIGIIINDGVHYFQHRVLRGVCKAAEESDVNLFCFAGAALEDPYNYKANKNVLYDIIKPSEFDGFVVMSGVISAFVSNKELLTFVERFRVVPSVSVSIRIPGMPSVLSDNELGIYELMDHFCKVHKYRNIATIRGPVGHKEADARFDAYREGLSRNGLQFRPELVVPGDFWYFTGARGIATLIDERREEFDAIFAADDEMAVGAIQELGRRGIGVPEDVAVAGFDNNDESQTLRPPLTTVDQPIFQLGYTAFKTLLELLAGRNVPDSIIIPTSLVIRQSCRCESVLVKSVYTEPVPKRKGTRSKAGTGISKSPIVDIVPIVEGIAREDAEECVRCFINDVKNGDKSSSFLTALRHVVYKGFDSGVDATIFQLFLGGLRTKSLPIWKDALESSAAESLLHMANAMLGEIVLTDMKNRKIENSKQNMDFMDFANALGSSFDLDEIRDLIIEKLATFRINSFYISVYSRENPVGELFSKPADKSKVFLAYRDNARLDHSNGNREFDTHILIPKELLPEGRKYTLLIESLCARADQLGFMLIELAPEDFPVHKILHEAISSSLKGAILLREIHKLNEELDRRVRQRTTELDTANTELRSTVSKLTKTQKELVESEKLASLGRLVAGFAHEINTPIGICVTAASHLEKRTKELDAMFSSSSLRKSDLADYMETAREASMLVLSNLNRANELLVGFKNIAVDQSSEQRRLFRVKEYVKDILLSLRPHLKKVKHVITIDCPEDLALFNHPGAFAQILTNFIINSLTHGLDENEAGTITISFRVDGNTVVFTYTDNGRGIDKADIDKIFDPFFTTNRGKGNTGMGLHIVYNLVRRSLRGSIECASEKNKGVKFTIVFPIS